MLPDWTGPPLQRCPGRGQLKTCRESNYGTGLGCPNNRGHFSLDLTDGHGQLMQGSAVSCGIFDYTIKGTQ
jgi:hypothetical protein